MDPGQVWTSAVQQGLARYACYSRLFLDFHTLSTINKYGIMYLRLKSGFPSMWDRKLCLRSWYSPSKYWRRAACFCIFEAMLFTAGGRGTSARCPLKHSDFHHVQCGHLADHLGPSSN